MSASTGQPSASTAVTTTALARVSFRPLRYREFARKLTLPGVACESVATWDTLRSGDPRSVKPKRTANSPRLISSCTCAHPRAKASSGYLLLPAGLAGDALAGGEAGKVVGLVLSTANTFAV